MCGLALLTLFLTLFLTHRARADLPGTIPLSAAGDGHLWWVVQVDPQSLQASAAASSGESAAVVPSYALMHHTIKDAEPSERLAMRFASEPVAIAAHGARVVIVTRDERGGRLYLFSLFAVKNEVTASWMIFPRGGPLPLAAPPVDGEVRATALVNDQLVLLLRPKRADARAPELHWLGVIPCESGAGSVWNELPLPPLELSESVGLFARENVLAAVGSKDGRATLAWRNKNEMWESTPLTRAEAAVAPRAVVGAFEVAQRTVLVERVLTPDRNAASLRLGILRENAVQPWAEFPEPRAPWSIAPLGARARLLELRARGGASLRALSFSAELPEAAVEFLPPGFSSATWMHLPIIGVLSVALLLSAVIFGSDAYLEGRVLVPSAVPLHARTIRGASLFRRASAMLIDMLPGMVVVWFFVRGTPMDLLQIPAFSPNLETTIPAVIVFSVGWFVASVGDVLFGRSMGKRLVGLRIIAARGGPAPVSRRLLRALLSAITVTSPAVMLLALLHPRGDGPAEMITGTAVVDAEEADAAGAARDEADGGGENRPG